MLSDNCLECGYEFNHYFVKGEILPEEITCPICGQEYTVKKWYLVEEWEEGLTQAEKN